MIYNFLTSQDLKQAIKTEFITQISENDNDTIARAENRAVSYMKDFLSHRFPVADAFPSIKDWNANTQYTIPSPTTIIIDGEETSYTPPYTRNANGSITNYCFYLNEFYQTLEPNTNIAPNTIGQTQWQKYDPREPKLTGFVVDITLFYLNQRIQPTKIPPHRADAYNQAKEWLMMVKDGDITPDLPRYPDKVESVDTILWGSNLKRDYYY